MAAAILFLGTSLLSLLIFQHFLFISGHFHFLMFSFSFNYNFEILIPLGKYDLWIFLCDLYGRPLTLPL